MVTQTTVRELLDISSFAHNARLDRYRTDISYAKKMIITLQNDLSNLKSAEMFVLQKMNRNQTLDEINQFYTIDRHQTIEPTQTFKPLANPDIAAPDPRINYSRNRLLDGNERLQAERDRLGAEILKVSSELQKQKAQLEKVQSNLQSIGGAPIGDQVEKDGIAKRLYTEVYMLYEVHNKYRRWTYDDNGNRLFNSDPTTLKEVQKLGQMFQTYSERNPYVISGDLVLDYDDPGSDFNEKSITALLERVRQILIPPGQTLDAANQKFITKLQGEVNDSYVSKELSRELDLRIPTQNNALKTATNTPAGTVGLINDKLTVIGGLKIIMTWDGKSQAEALTNGFTKFISGLNNGVPFCKPQPVSPSLQESSNLEAAQGTAETNGGQIVVTAFAESKTITLEKDFTKTINQYLLNIQKAIANRTLAIGEQAAPEVSPTITTTGSSTQTRTV